MKSYSWTKLLLDESMNLTTLDDPLLHRTANGSIIGVPAGKSAGDVVCDYLTFLYQHCIEQLERHLSPALLDVTPLEFWFTMPAVWPDRARFATKQAAKRSGFGSRSIDTVFMITEPEAVATAALMTHSNDHADTMKVGAGIRPVNLSDVFVARYWFPRMRLWRWHSGKPGQK